MEAVRANKFEERVERRPILSSLPRPVNREIDSSREATLDTIVGGGSSLRSRRWLRSVSLDFFEGEVEFSSAMSDYIFCLFLFSWRLIKIQTHWISSNPTRISSRGGF